MDSHIPSQSLVMSVAFGPWPWSALRSGTTSLKETGSEGMDWPGILGLPALALPDRTESLP
jgi:hypothetical protein